MKGERGNRKNFLANNSMNRAFDYFENVLNDARTRVEFSQALYEAQKQESYWAIGVFDVDSIIFDYKKNDLTSLWEIKTKEQVISSVMSGYFSFKESQYILTKMLAEQLNRPFYWLIRNREVGLWYVTEIRRATEKKEFETVVMKRKYGKREVNERIVRMDIDRFLTLSDEEFVDWLRADVLDL